MERASGKKRGESHRGNNVELELHDMGRATAEKQFGKGVENVAGNTVD